jgi:phage head maturation protease
MSNVSYAWAPITKSEQGDDGTLTVYGPAASSALDRDQQRMADAWLDEAMPRWLAEGGGVREQHDPRRAVGVGVGLSKGDDGAHYLTAKIVDPVAVKKIQHGVLRGFSVGIKNPKVEMGKAEAPNGLVIDGDVIEVSVVDRPCNPTTLFSIATKADGAEDLALVEDAQVVEKSDAEAFGLPTELYDRLAAPVKEALARLADGGATVTAEAVKADGEPVPQLAVSVHVTAPPPAVEKADLSAAGRREAAASGAAMPDGSYPIKTKSDLRKAIRAVGRGGADHDKIRRHVIKRAKALGLEGMMPENWQLDGSLKDATKAYDPDTPAPEAAVADPDIAAKAEEILRDVRALAPSLAKADDAKGGHDEAKDIAGAEQAIACIAQLIITEAESLAMGNLNEACDIALLLDAVRSLKWFKDNEEREEAEMALADTPDLAKTDVSGDTPQAPVTDPAPEVLTKADVTELIKAAAAEATTAAEERAQALAADLAKANAAIEEFRQMPVPGGPVLTPTGAQQAVSRKADADRLRAEADELLAKADRFGGNPGLAQGYRERAQELLAKADA